MDCKCVHLSSRNQLSRSLMCVVCIYTEHSTLMVTVLSAFPPSNGSKVYVCRLRCRLSRTTPPLPPLFTLPRCWLKLPQLAEHALTNPITPYRVGPIRPRSPAYRRKCSIKCPIDFLFRLQSRARVEESECVTGNRMESGR